MKYSLFVFVFFPPLSFVSARRSSPIRPGQFGYGKVPFSLPLHRPNRQARHTANGTDTATQAPGLAVSEDEAENNRREEEERGSDGEDREVAGREEEEKRKVEQESSEPPAAEEAPATKPPHRHVDRPSYTHTEHVRGRVPSSHSFSRPSSPSLSNRHRFDWHSVTAPPPPVSPLSRPNSPAVASPFSPPLHRSVPVHRDRDLHPGFSPQAPPAGNIYPLQHHHVPHLGVESGRDGGRGAPQVFRCSGPEKEYRRCFSQVKSSPINPSNKRNIPPNLQSSHPLNSLSNSLQLTEHSPLLYSAASVYSLQLIYMHAMC